MKFSVVDGRIFNPGDLSWDGFRALAEVTVTNFETEPPLAAVIDCLQGSQGAMLRQRVVKRELLEACPELKFIDLTSTGYDQVDRETLDYAARHGVTICNIPAYGTPAVAQHTFALLLGLLRQVPRCDAGMRGGKWEQGAILGREVQGRTFGIVGMGAIGRCVASIAQGFGGRVTGFDPYWPEAFAAERNIERRDLDTLLRESDFVCIHCPLTPQTENLIGTRELGLMKPSSVLVNMARGGIVDESALYDALTARHISGAVLDAFSQEPPSSMPFAALPNVLLSPHVGAFTEEALEKMSRIAVDH